MEFIDENNAKRSVRNLHADLHRLLEDSALECFSEKYMLRFRAGQSWTELDRTPSFEVKLYYNILTTESRTAPLVDLVGLSSFGGRSENFGESRESLKVPEFTDMLPSDPYRFSPW